MSFTVELSPTLIAYAVAIWVLYLSFRRSSARKTSCPLPPGPPGKFLIGNLGQISADRPEIDYIQWGKEYGSDVIHIEILGQHIICLNSAQAATDLLDRRGSIYCDRPRFTLFEVMGWGLTLTFLRWGPKFRLHRRLFHQTFSPSNIKVFRSAQLFEARKAVRSLLSNPADWKDVTLLMSTSIIFRIAFGQEVRSKDSPYCDLSRAANDATTGGGTPGSTLVDLFPLARHLPDCINFSPSLRHARQSRPAIRAIHDYPWNVNFKDMEAGTAAPSFMKTHVERLLKDQSAGIPQEVTLEDIRGATGAIFIAGGNTTWSTVQSCILFLTKYPDTQRRIQQELDLVVGRDRLPTFDDRPHLPYLDRFINEVLRCLPLNPLVIPHKSIRGDVYRGMFIPKGSIVFANATAMLTDPAVYRDPHVFDPDRYLRGEPHPPANFGFGRRKCPGSHLALASVYIFTATLMAAFNIEKAVGKDGQPLEPKAAVSVGLGGHPERFDCVLRPRSDTKATPLLFQS